VPAIIRPAAVAGTQAISPTITVGATGVPLANVTATPVIGAAQSASTTTATTLSASAEANYKITGATVINTATGADAAADITTPFAVDGSGNATISVEPKMGEDLIVEFTYSMPPDPTHSSISWSATTPVASPMTNTTGMVGTPVEGFATVQDSSNTLMSGVTVDLALGPGSSATLQDADGNPITSCVTDSTGQCSFYVADNKAEPVTVTGQIDGVTGYVNPGSTGITVTFSHSDVSTTAVCQINDGTTTYQVKSGQVYPYPFTTANSTTTPATPDTVVPTGTSLLSVGSTQQLRTYLFDANCNPLPGYTVNLTGTPVNTPATSTITQPTTPTDAIGMASGSVTDTKNETVAMAGTYTQGTDTGPLAAADVAFSVGVPSATSSAVTVSPSTQTAGTNVTVTVTVKDGSNNPINGLAASDIKVTGAYVAGSGTAGSSPTFVVDPTSFTPLGNGQYAYQATSDLVGKFNVTAVAENVTIAQQPQAHFLPGTVDPGPVINPTCPVPPIAGQTQGTGISAAPGTVTIPQTSTASVLVTDADCNPLPGVTVDLTINNNGTLSAATATTGDGTNGTTLGVATVTVSDTTPETVTVQATIPSSDAPTTPVTGTNAAKTGADVQFLQTGTPSIATPTSGTIIVTATPTITGGGGVPGDTVTVKDANGNPVCTTTITSSDGTWSCTVSTALPAGSNTLTAVQTDTSGNPSPASNPVTVTVDTTPPALTNPASGSTLATATPTISGTGATPGSTVTVTDGHGNTVCTATVPVTDTTGDWTCTPTTPLPAGANTLTPTQVDSQGNQGPAGDPRTITVNTTASSIDPLGPTNNPRPPISGKGTVPGDKVTVKDGDGSTVCTATIQADGAWSCTPSAPLPDGTHNLTATEQDSSGNSGTPSAPVAVLVDAALPKPPVLNPTDGTTISGTADPGTTIQIWINGAQATVPGCENVVADANRNFSCTPTTPMANQSVFFVKAVNALGTVSLPSNTVTVGAVAITVQTGGLPASSFGLGAGAAGVLGFVGLWLAIVAIRRRDEQQTS